MSSALLRPLVQAGACPVLLLAFAGGCSAPGVTWPELAASERAPQDPEPGGPQYLQDYKESYYRALGPGFTDTLTREQLLGEIDRTRILYLGDHHADQQLHERLVELLQQVQTRGRTFVLALEAIGLEHEREVAAFLERRLEMTELRAQVVDSWLDHEEVDSAFYRYLLLAARQWRVPVFALEQIPRLPLAQRDAVIAARVRRIALAHPEALVVVVVGHAHLLGQGGLVARVGLPHVALGARLSVALQRQLTARPAPRGAFVRTTSGVVFFAAAPDAVTGEVTR